MEVLQTGKPLTFGDVTLIAIECTGIQSNRGKAGYWLSGSKQLYAVVVSDSSGVRAFDADSIQIELDELLQKIPKLGSLLAQC